MNRYFEDHNEIVSEYKDEIFKHMRELQDEMLPDPNYMAIKQRDTRLNWEMRSQLILWLVEVHSRYSLRREILFLAINYLDRFLSLKEVSIDKLQLVGITALSIAIKYEDGNRLTFKGLQKLCGSYKAEDFRKAEIYKAEDFRKAEIYMLDKLRYKLGWPGPLIFVRKINEIDNLDCIPRYLAMYFLEAILLDKKFVAERPSITAAAAYCLARCMLGMGEWTPLHVRISEYNYSQLYPLMAAILEWLNGPQESYLAVFNKYSFRQRGGVAPFVKKKLDSGFVIEDQSPASIVSARC